MAFAKAEVGRQAPSYSLREEQVRAREMRVAADEEMLNAREIRLSRQQEELQRRLRMRDAQEKAYLEAEEMLQIRAALDEDRLE